MKSIFAAFCLIVWGASDGAPVVVFPMNGQSNILLNDTLKWQANSSDEFGLARDSFQVQLFKTDTLHKLKDSTRFASSVVGQSFKYVNSQGQLNFFMEFKNLDSSSTYIWRIGLKMGNVISWSQLQYFRSILGTPALISPGNNSQNISPTIVQYKWTKRNSSFFNFQMSKSSNLSSFVLNLNQASLTDTIFTVSSLDSGTVYYWRTQATNSGNAGPSPWSTVWSFHTISPPTPTPPTVIAPSPGMMSVVIPTNFTWSASSGAKSYRLQISTASDFSALIMNDSTVTGTSKTIAGLLNNTVYYWRINAKNADVTSAYSNIAAFKTAGASPIRVSLMKARGSKLNQITTSILGRKYHVTSNVILRVK